MSARPSYAFKDASAFAEELRDGVGEAADSVHVRPGRNVFGWDRVEQSNWRVQDLSHENEYSLSSRNAGREVRRIGRAGTWIGAAMLMSGEAASGAARLSGDGKEGRRKAGLVGLHHS